MLKNERKLNYMVGLIRKVNDLWKSWIGKKISFCPSVHPWQHMLLVVQYAVGCAAYVRRSENKTNSVQLS